MQTAGPPSVIPGPLVSVLLAMPWLIPWAPGPQSNTVPLLVSWATLTLLLLAGHLPSALELARAWVWAAVISSLMGLLQYFGEAAPLGGWVHVPAYLGEAAGNLRQRNQLATLTSLGAVAVLWWQAHGLRAGHAGWMLAVMALGNAATGSRTGLLQWCLLPLLVLLWQRHAPDRRAAWPWRTLLWGLAVYALASAALPHALGIWSGNQVSSAIARMGEMQGCGTRSTLWRNVLQLIGQRPWTGWGWDELKFAHYMADYSGPRFCDILGNAHNLPLHLAFALGVPAAVIVTGGVAALVLRARPWRLAHEHSSLAWGVLAVILVHSLLEYPLWYGPFQLAALCSVLLLWPAAVESLGRQRRAVQGMALAGLCLLSAIAWDYHRVRQIYLPASQRSPLWQVDPWQVARETWFFGQAVRFAELTSTPVTPQNAPAMLELAQAMLHYSPEPRVVERLIDSARLVGRDDLAQWHQRQLQAVYGTTR